MDESFLLKTEGARRLYRVARDLPIIDFHNHLSVAEMAADRRFNNLTEIWLSADPYKHRLMRICGVEEREDGTYRFDIYFNASKTNIEKSSILKKLKSQCRKE